MAQALSPSTANGGDGIVILYGPTFRSRAVELSHYLQRNNQQRMVCAKPIPEFAHLEPWSGSREGTPSPRQSMTTTQLSRQQKPAVESRRDDAVVLFTSGTTSSSFGAKGVRLSHEALLIQARAKLGPPCALSSTTRMVATAMPFFHVGGLANVLAVWMAGGSIVLADDSCRRGTSRSSGGFDPVFVWKAIAQVPSPSHKTSKTESEDHHQHFNANTLVMVPAMLHLMQKALPAPDTRLDHVQLVMIGGQSASPDSLRFCRRVFPCAQLVQTYSCTEAASSMTFHNVTTTAVNAEPPLAGDCVGKPPTHVQLALFDASCTGTTHETVDRPYQVGLIATRGPHVMNGYWNASADAGQVCSSYRPEGWLVTSDLGFWDNQRNLFFCGRSSDTVRTGGETVMALEVERVLQTHGWIEEVAVFALRDEEGPFGELVACALVPAKGKGLRLSLEVIRKFCKEGGLAGYKCPRAVFLLDHLPRNSSGKVLKPLLKEGLGNVSHKQSALRSKL